MPTVKIEAPEGVIVSALIQKRTLKPSVITKQGFDANGNPSIVQEFGPKQVVWEDQSVDQFASEVRSYELAADERVVATPVHA